MKIGSTEVGSGAPAYVIAEVGVNHDGELGRALELVDACAAAGANAVKFQTFRPSELAVTGAPLAEYQRRSGAEVSSQRQMLERLALGERDFAAIAERCAGVGVHFLSSPFDAQSGAMLVRLGVPAIKVGSGEITNLPLLRDLASHGLPLLVSTGMADLDEVREVVEAVDPVPVALLHCVSSYPTPPEQANLRAIDTLRRAFTDVVVGYSDHCEGLDVSLAAIALGAAVLERHVTYNRAAAGPDHAISLLPDELGELIRRARVIERALGDGRKTPQLAERGTMRVARRSLVATRRLQPGDVIDETALTAKRPGGGLSPARAADLIGRSVRRPIQPDEPFVEGDLDA